MWAVVHRGLGKDQNLVDVAHARAGRRPGHPAVERNYHVIDEVEREDECSGDPNEGGVNSTSLPAEDMSLEAQHLRLCIATLQVEGLARGLGGIRRSHKSGAAVLNSHRDVVGAVAVKGNSPVLVHIEHSPLGGRGTVEEYSGVNKPHDPESGEADVRWKSFARIAYLCLKRVVEEAVIAVATVG